MAEGTTIRAEANALQTGREALLTAHDDINGAIDDVRDALDGIGSWAGDAADAFTAFVDQWVSQAETANKRLFDLSDDLHKTQVLQEQDEGEHQARINSIANMMS